MFLMIYFYILFPPTDTELYSDPKVKVARSKLELPVKDILKWKQTNGNLLVNSQFVSARFSHFNSTLLIQKYQQRIKVFRGPCGDSAWSISVWVNHHNISHSSMSGARSAALLSMAPLCRCHLRNNRNAHRLQPSLHQPLLVPFFFFLTLKTTVLVGGVGMLGGGSRESMANSEWKSKLGLGFGWKGQWWKTWQVWDVGSDYRFFFFK